MGVSTDAILFYGYCWGTRGDEDIEINDWETRYARAKGCPPPTQPFPAREVPRTKANNWDSTPKDYTVAEQAIIDQYKAYWGAKEEIVDTSSCLVGTHCSASYPMPYVAVRASVTKSHRGCPSEIEGLTVEPAWDAQLVEFCAAMGIFPLALKATWWLVSDWSE